MFLGYIHRSPDGRKLGYVPRFPDERKLVVMFLGSPRKIRAYVSRCHVAEEHKLCSLAPTA
jgi:hypothetical protein